MAKAKRKQKANTVTAREAATAAAHASSAAAVQAEGDGHDGAAEQAPSPIDDTAAIDADDAISRTLRNFSIRG